MESKFHLLSIGQNFEWEGKHYVKTTPLIATQVPEGGQKFMPRAALVKILGTENAPIPAIEPPATLDSAIVRSAINRYHQRCVQVSSSDAQQDRSVVAQVQSELERLYRDLLIELKL